MCSLFTCSNFRVKLSNDQNHGRAYGRLGIRILIVFRVIVNIFVSKCEQFGEGKQEKRKKEFIQLENLSGFYIPYLIIEILLQNQHRQKT